MSAVIESMTKFRFASGGSVRVWREQVELKDDYSDEDADLYRSLHEINADMFNAKVIGAKGIIKRITKLPRINAVEVLNRFDTGVVFYPEWP